METKKVTLDNGTVLNEGEKYNQKGWDNSCFVEIKFIGEDKFFGADETGSEYSYFFEKNWLPYTPPTPQKEWKTFLIEFSGIKYRAILQYETLEQAQFHHPNAISITEVRLNIEEVK